jgi:predicted alpha/beta hydrolase
MILTILLYILHVKLLIGHFKSRGSVVMFHGNGMDYGDCIPGAMRMNNMGYTVLILSYRG